MQAEKATPENFECNKRVAEADKEFKDINRIIKSKEEEYEEGHRWAARRIEELKYYAMEHE